MSINSKNKVVDAFRKLFHSSNKMIEPKKDEKKSSSSPRRLLCRHKTDAVQPAESHLSEQPGPSLYDLLKDKKSSVNNSQKPIEKQVGIRQKRLMKEFAEIQKIQNHPDSSFTAELINDNLFEWHIRLKKIDEESQLFKDMTKLGINHILLHISFPENFPFSPPFLRVISPFIERGFVMEGGAICMELLTPKGWASAYTVEAVITQFAASVVKGQGRIYNKTKNFKEFNQRSAKESFRSLVKTHDKYGWVTPSLSEG
ncbi:ubiquitin-conjugating enzyme E2Q-like protein CG4502 [Trichogramma pretiosum]|uniref:ubiquitin-conjugating enzyme E2Q-like protein CG4502 n=1 Tax=Trichogramma pretiosum TaxID=7493 RepID=UPI0006C9CCE5|nr:ubiquitin-conjugating enzyme E2Q-like protein CG4502 [Trichogramma pretiosum]XP_014233201.1 ubiquitin-conjugating enzyme E2Q-like protein CG4502 [Trichogramma pretiosum]XP_014233202.1 ubiquitin-conjugating enzyme E2Q-like protein CG4502 [Trichogramma pretiosum]